MANESYSDEELAAAVQAGRPDLYAKIIERYQPRLTRFALSLIGDADTAEDAVQETFIKAYKNLQSFNPRRKFSSWIYRIAHNESVNLLKKRRNLSFDQDPSLANVIASQAGYSRLEELVDKRLVREAVEKCLGRLQMKYRAPVILYYLQGSTYREISDVLRLPVSTVGVRIKRAKSRLAEICKTMGVAR